MFEKKETLSLTWGFEILKKIPKPYLEVLSRNNNNKRETDIGGSPKEKQRTTQHWSQLPTSKLLCLQKGWKFSYNFDTQIQWKFGGAGACQGLWCVTDVDTACVGCDTCACARFFPTLVLHSSSSSISSIGVYLEQYYSFWQRQESALWFNTLYLTAPRHHYS